MEFDSRKVLVILTEKIGHSNLNLQIYERGGRNGSKTVSVDTISIGNVY